MTVKEITNKIKHILEELSYPSAVAYLTLNDKKWLKAAIKALEQEPCEDAVSRQAVLDAIDVKAWEFCDYLISKNRNDEQKPVSHFADTLRECVREELPSVNPQPKTGHWIPVSERLPKKSYCASFWLTVKLDNGEITTLKGKWSCWSDTKGNSFDAFDCWEDVMINGRELRLSQPIPKEQVLAWMPLPESYKAESEDKG